METVFTIFIFFGVIAVTALVFGGWLIVSIVRFVIRSIASAVDPTPPMPRTVVQEGVVCRNNQCRCANPAGVRFCRRCGSIDVLVPSARRRTPLRRIVHRIVGNSVACVSWLEAAECRGLGQT